MSETRVRTIVRNAWERHFTQIFALTCRTKRKCWGSQDMLLYLVKIILASLAQISFGN